ncbi:MAG: hypothetical protein NUW01_07125, partial [Gemmatimonadaceae bacterium]|nr:hypothetical protein [Gemmatimonadaceae bacterium]
MTLLTTIQSACSKIGITRPTVVVGSTDVQVVELLDLANEEGRELTKAGQWRDLMGEKTFTTVAQAAQTSALPTDFGRFIDETFFNRSTARRVFGPISPEEWQTRQAFTAASSINSYFRLRGTGVNAILMTPTPSAGNTCAFEYIKNTWCQSSASVAQSSWAADTDTGVLDENLMALGITFRFLKKKGLGTWQAAYLHYTDQVNIALAQD